MFASKLYYLLKPAMPWSLRIALRRCRATLRRRSHADVWPIDEKAGTTPPGWPGWPGGKRFAVVLTHDVEGSKGLSRVEQLMNLELKHGFRSSFNFVPEGEYRVPDSLRSTLMRSGFEVGIHGLEHDGKLYESKQGFVSKASRIREYRKEWQASGFRSPFMQHKLAWLHELGMEYDSSTFDSDPFEPQPDGFGTIFPFWVSGGDGGGFVELPYTLCQDFNLFVILREQNLDLWKRKLDWIAERGGMVLLNTHPDYMCFGDDKKARDEFSVGFYEELLRYVREKYEGAFWPALPAEVARFYCAQVPLPSRNSRKKICMLVHSNYEDDSRVRQYAEALAKRGDIVDVIATTEKSVPLGPKNINGVTVHHIQRHQYNKQSKWTHAWGLTRFLSSSSALLKRRHEQIRYDVIHVHNMPDFLVFAAWYPKLTGAKIILDIHDLVPELFSSKFKAKATGYYVRLLQMLEKASVAFADHVIVANHLWQQKLVSRSVPEEKCSVFLNHLDPAIFYRRARTRNDGRIVVLFPGSLHWHQGLDLALDAFARVRARVPNAEFHIYESAGDESAQADLARQSRRLGLNGAVKFCGRVPLDCIADVMANADLGVVPKRADSFGDEACSTKILEFMSQGVPVVVSRTKIDSLYFDETLVRFFRAGDSADMADAMIEVIKNKELREGLVAAGNQNVQRYSWDLRKNDYLQLIDSLSTHLLGDTKIPAVAPFHGAARSSGGAAESVPGCAPYKFTKAQNS